jgi:hypothetical protein
MEPRRLIMEPRLNLELYVKAQPGVVEVVVEL